VRESHRRLGIGRALFGYLGCVARENGCPRLDFVVLKVCVYSSLGTIYSLLSSVTVERAVDRFLQVAGGSDNVRVGRDAVRGRCARPSGDAVAGRFKGAVIGIARSNSKKGNRRRRP
jgi:hypothetical protein